VSDSSDGRMHVHFLGICGYAVSGAALTARDLGHLVTGSDDEAYPPTTTILTDAGITWTNRSDPANLDRNGRPDLVVVGNQTRPGNSELEAARALGLPLVSEPEFWEQLTRDRLRIAVCGTHGKTTTASLLAWMLETAGMQPGFRLGATSRDFQASARLGDPRPGAPFVFEGDEYTTAPWDPRPKFLHTQPKLACVTILEHDHPDVYPDMASYLRPFRELVAGLPAEGRLVVFGDNPECLELATGAHCPVVIYGQATGALHQQGAAVQEPDKHGGFRQRFTIVDERPDFPDRHEVTLALPGAHNRLNTMAALLLAGYAAAPLQPCLEACRTFRGPTRRFEVKGVHGGITVVDDYGHHPAEVAAVIHAARERYPEGRLLVLNIPHTYSRTLTMLDEYESCYQGADLVLVGPIEAARERAQEAPVTKYDVAARARHTVPRAGTVGSAGEAIEELVQEARSGDVVLCIALGGFDGVADRLAAALQERHGE
jgi:UDP-N-acetylmuramate: L-alanyl-gamma-D-glutamyl-meso-diaminopimelate ligase